MGIDTYFYVGPYAEAPDVEKRKIVKGKQCTGSNHHKIKNNARFCSHCGASVEEVVISDTVEKSRLSLYEFLDELTSEQKTEIGEKMNITSRSLEDAFGSCNDLSDDIAWYIYDKRIEYKNISGREGGDFVIGEDSVKNSIATFKEIFAPLQEIIESKYNVRLNIAYGVLTHYG